MLAPVNGTRLGLNCMVTDRETWADAGKLIAEHGEEAALYAELYMGPHLLNLDRENAERWHRAKVAVEWLQDPQGPAPFKLEH